jgi:hypothetical protein
MKFSSALFRQRISDILTAANPLQRDPPNSTRRVLRSRLRRRLSESGPDESYPAIGLEEVIRSVAALSERLDLFAVESTRRQNQNELLARRAIARMDLLLHELRPDRSGSEEDDLPAEVVSASAAAPMVVIADVDGHAVAVPGNDRKLAWHYLLRGGLEPGLERFMRRVVKPGMVFVDAGAGVGIYTILAAVLMGGEGKIISLEPDPRAYSILVWNLERNGLNSTPAIWHSVESIAAQENGAVPGVDPANPHVDLMRVGADQISTWLPAYLGGISDLNPQMLVMIEYCSSLAGTEVPALSFLDQILSTGFEVRKVDSESGECFPVNREEFASSFSTNLVVQRKL